MCTSKIILLLFIHLFFHQSCKGIEANQQSTMTSYNHNPTDFLLGSAGIGFAWYLNILIKKTLHEGARKSPLVDRINHPVTSTASRGELDSIIPISNNSSQEYKHMVRAFTIVGMGIIATPLLLLMRENFLLTGDLVIPSPTLQSSNLKLTAGTLMGAPFLWQGFNVFHAIQEKEEDERRALEYWQYQRQEQAQMQAIEEEERAQARMREEQAAVPPQAVPPQKEPEAIGTSSPNRTPFPPLT